MKVSPLPGCGAELNWKILFIPPVCRRGIRFVYNWFRPGEGGRGGGSFAADRLRFSSWWKGWLNLFSLVRHPLPVAKSDHLSSHTSTHTLHATQAVHWWMCFKCSPLTLFLVRFCLSDWPLKACLAVISSYHSTKKRAATHAVLWWHILTRAGNVTICPTNGRLHLAVTRSPVKGSALTGLPL